MHRIISFLLIFMAITTNARQVSPDEAQAIATEFFNGSIVKSAPKRNARFATNKQLDVEPYYIFNASDDNGFVIISGDTRTKKILGYSDRGSFDTGNMPPQLTAMLEQYAMQLSELPESGIQDASWSESQTRSEEGGILLETARWDQQYPFNLMTPENCVTGCVPTAVAIIMRFHKWPEKGLGNTSYEMNGHKVSFDFDNAYFDWDSMPLDYIEGQYTHEQALEVSKAMYAAGNAVHAIYGEYETSGSLPAYGMYRYLKFDIPKRYAVIHDALELCLNKFLQTVHSEITASRPMLLDVRLSADEDHIIIADGFDSQNYVHLNYGWGGTGNGFYNPEIIIATTRYFYSNIRPDRKATIDREEILPDDGALSNSNSGGPLHSGLVILGEIKPNEDFGFIYHIAFPIDPLLNFELGLLHISSQGRIKDVLWSTPDLLLPNCEASGQSWTSITKDIEDNDRVTLAYKKKETDEWHIIKDTPNAKASISITDRERDYIHFSVVSDPGVDFSVGSYAIIEDQKDLWNYSGKIEKCYFNLNASVNEPFMLGTYNLRNNIGCAAISINGLEIGQIEHNYLNTDPIVETTISHISNLMPYLPDSIIVEVKKYRYDEMLNIEKHVDKAGTLNQLLTLDDARNTRSLTLTGQIDVNDLKFVENQCPFLQLLDMSEADIIGGSIPCSAYVESTKMLRQIKLPRNLKSIESDAFMGESGHGGIRIVYIPAGVEEIGDRAFMWGPISSVVMANPKPIDLRGRELHNEPFRYASVIYVPKGSKLAYENAGWGQWNGEFFERTIIEYDGEFIPIDSLTFSPEIITLKIGESLSVNPVIHPNNSTEQWTGSLRLNELGCGIINLKDNNCIEAIGEGCGLLTVNHSNFYAHLLVNVIDKPIPIESIVIIPANIEDEVGKEYQLTTVVNPKNATNKEITWSSDNEDVAIVDKSGLLRLIAIGSTSITASALDGSGVYAECQVIVNNTSSIEEILADKNVEVKVYNMTGLLIYEGKYSDANLSEGLYIVTTGNSVNKLMVK